MSALWSVLRSAPVWLGLAAGGFAQSAAPAPIAVPLTAQHWRTVQDQGAPGKPDVRFATHEGFPQGILVVKSGDAVLQGLAFRNGTIEFDIKGLAHDIPGIQFRRSVRDGQLNAEEFYVRTFPDCRASDDCIQYAPIIHAFMLWNAYPQYQTRAFILDGWNHIKLVISGRRMNVYVNGFAQPALAVGKLESDAVEGSIALRGPAMFANLTVSPDAVEGLPPQPTPDPTAHDRGVVRSWELGPLTAPHYGRAPEYSEMPTASRGWKTVTAGRFGLVNLNREFTLALAPPQLTWLRFDVNAQRAMAKHVSLGWLGQVWVFVNGKLVTQGRNFYDPDGERRAPDGRLSLENGSFNLPLQQGQNEVVLALDEGVHDNDHTPNRYGWGVAMRFDDPAGLQLSR